jgi:hypothetical protein
MTIGTRRWIDSPKQGTIPAPLVPAESYNLYRAQCGRCFYCNMPMSPRRFNNDVDRMHRRAWHRKDRQRQFGDPRAKRRVGGFTEDHVVPRVGGYALENNKVLACDGCNRTKGCRQPTEVELGRAMLLYAQLGLLFYPHRTKGELRRYRQKQERAETRRKADEERLAARKLRLSVDADTRIECGPLVVEPLGTREDNGSVPNPRQTRRSTMTKNQKIAIASAIVVATLVLSITAGNGIIATIIALVGIAILFDVTWLAIRHKQLEELGLSQSVRQSMLLKYFGIVVVLGIGALALV